MVAVLIGRRLLTISAIVVGLGVLAAPGYAQTGAVKGKVVDGKNQPIEGAKITIAMTEGMNRRFETKTNRRGEFIQIGLTPGAYEVTAEKDGLTQTFPVRVRIDTHEVNFTLKPGGEGVGASAEERKKAEARMAAIKAAFEEGVKLNNAGKYDEAIAKFNEVAAEAPKCVECYTNIGSINLRKKDLDAAEAAFKKAIEINPNAADAYNGLATVYNSQKKFDQAAEASSKAQQLAAAANPGGAGDASTSFNQGVILWNAGKIQDAKKNFEDAVRLDPKLADAHYWLGMALVNEGKLPEAAPHFEDYLKLAPSGQYADTAKSILTTIKK
jgi:tetratricopeptide (TPR) repeat protein